MKGTAFRTCQRTSSSRSAARAGTFSNFSSDTFATLSGMASAIRLGRAPMRSSTRRSASLTARGSTMFAAFSEGDTAPAGSGSTACAATASAESRTTMEAAETRCLAISMATVGSAAERTDRAIIRRTSPC